VPLQLFALAVAVAFLVVIPAGDLLPFPQRICFCLSLLLLPPLPGGPFFAVSSRRVGYSRHARTGISSSIEKSSSKPAPFNATQTIVILSGAKNPCISSLLLLLHSHSHSHLHLHLHRIRTCICILHFAFALQVPAVILNAVKDPEETTQQPPYEPFNPSFPAVARYLRFAF
jgi:hypothetical protein